MSRIFISYRRADSEAITGRIYDHLVQALGEDSVFQDVESIPAGVNFKDYLETTVSACDILLVVIGKQWLTVTDAEGNRRLDQPNDFVAIEVEAGLKRSDMRVIPLLVDGASMPGADDLPPRLSDLHFRNAMRIRHNPDFNSDMDKLIQQITGESSGRRSLRRLGPLAVGLALVVVGVVIIPMLLNPAPDAPASPTPGATDTVAALTATPLSTQIPAASFASTETFVINTSSRWVNVYAGPEASTRILGIALRGDSVSYDPASLTDDGWLMIVFEDGTGWVRAASVGYQACLIADGFDLPVGTEEERRSSQIWPGEWFNPAPFAQLYFVGTPNEAYHTGADLNLPDDADRNQPIYAVGSGTVIAAQRFPVWGNVIIIQHDPLYDCDGEVIFTRYTQVGDMLVQSGERVERGQMITTVGNSNGGFDYKLHFDMSRSPGLAQFSTYWPRDDLEGLRENFVDPRQYIEDHRPRSSVRALFPLSAIILVMTTTHTHPRPTTDRLTQYGALAFFALTAALFVWQIILALNGLPAALLLLTVLTMALLLAPALWLTTASPAVELTGDGLTLRPLLWRKRTIAWGDIRAVKPYPLLPEAQGERMRKAFVGRRKYVPAKGVMLVVPTLPWIYRCTGFFAGEGLTPVIALTNRTHTDYDRLIKGVRARTAEVWT